jgi:hypothetical protein
MLEEALVVALAELVQPHMGAARLLALQRRMAMASATSSMKPSSIADSHSVLKRGCGRRAACRRASDP